MIEPIRLWRRNLLRGHEPAWLEDEPKHPVYFTEYAALPRADFDAREARLARAEQERDEERRNHNHYGQLWLDVRRERDAATARAERAEKDRDDARALLREARAWMQSFANDIDDEQAWTMERRGREAREFQRRIDDALNRKHAERGPEPEGREGGDGAGEGGRE